MGSGIVRRIDDLGRIVIPREIRMSMGIAEGDPLEIGVNDDKTEITLTPYNLDVSDRINKIAVSLNFGIIIVEKFGELFFAWIVLLYAVAFISQI